MLDPRGRQLLLAALRPPEGFRFDCAVGTTFSLDLIALLTAPLAFAMFDWQDDEGRLAADPAGPGTDPLALLESLRRCADRIHLFCQAGQIKVPPTNQRLLAFLERAVIEVQPLGAKDSRFGVFHPKVWALRFVDAAGDRSVRYRLLCLSRNLTFDRSWDTVLLLDGELADRQKGFGENRTLSEFIARLPDLAVRPDVLTPQSVADVQRIAQELKVVKWELPEGVEEIRFWPMGMDGRRSWPFADRLDRLLVVSPFLTDGFLTKIGLDGRDQYMVSRPESLREINPAVLKDSWKCFTLEEGCDSLGSPEEDTPWPAAEHLSGLHAKLFVADAGRKAHVWTGSANATTAAFDGNIEFLVELIGKKAKLGIEATIGEENGSANLRAMLTPFAPPPEAVKPDPDEQAAEDLANVARRSLCGMQMLVRVTPQSGDGAGFTTTVESEDVLILPPSVTVRCRPIMLASPDARLVESGHRIAAAFGPHASESISSFVSFEVLCKVRDVERAEQFVLNLPMVGAPSDRRERLLRDLLRDSRTLLRFLLLLLSDDPERLFEELRELTLDPSGAQGRSNENMLPLLEHMLAALHKHPEKLDQVHRLIEDLKKTPEGRSILPGELEDVWGPIGRVRAATAQPRSGGVQ
jgi:hypothetical protein